MQNIPMPSRRLLLATGLACLLPAVARAAWTEIRAGRDGHFIVRARINGVRAQALIDTGASIVAIPYRLAERMGLKPAFLDFDVPLMTANGMARGARVRLRRVEIDNVVARDVEAVVMPRNTLEHVLIGMSFLNRLRRYSVRDGKLRLVQ